MCKRQSGNRQSGSKQSGFTLIELVVVITIIGILAAFALPKFAALQAEARMAKMNAALGSIKSAAAMAHAQLLVTGLSSTYTNAASPFSIEGVAVIFTNGYPTAATIGQLAGVTSPDYPAPTVAAGVATITADTNHATCAVTYTEAAAGSAPVFGNTGLTAANCQ